MQNPNVAAIIPAYNEEQTVGKVVTALKQSGIFDEIVVVSDGSTDRTAEVAREAGATAVYQLPIRSGKGKAMQHGVAHTDAPIISFFDADLLTLTPEHARALVTPVAEGKRAMNTGLRDRGGLLMWLEGHLPLIGGERAMQREVFEAIPDRYIQGFMVESALNYFCRANHMAYGGTPLPKLTMRRKYDKVGWGKAIGQYAHMYWQVALAMVLVRVHGREFRAHFIHEKHYD
jgi:glycosyltransferase involved in cell wall biosynthesis